MKKIAIVLGILAVLTAFTIAAVPSEKKEMPGMCLFIKPVGGMCMAATIPGTNYCLEHAPLDPNPACFCKYVIGHSDGSASFCNRPCMLGGNGKCRDHYSGAPPLQ